MYKNILISLCTIFGVGHVFASQNEVSIKMVYVTIGDYGFLEGFYLSRGKASPVKSARSKFVPSAPHIISVDLYPNGLKKEFTMLENDTCILFKTMHKDDNCYTRYMYIPDKKILEDFLEQKKKNQSDIYDNVTIKIQSSFSMLEIDLIKKGFKDSCLTKEYINAFLQLYKDDLVCQIGNCDTHVASQYEEKEKISEEKNDDQKEYNIKITNNEIIDNAKNLDSIEQQGHSLVITTGNKKIELILKNKALPEDQSLQIEGSQNSDVDVNELNELISQEFSVKNQDRGAEFSENKEKDPDNKNNIIEQPNQTQSSWKKWMCYGIATVAVIGIGGWLYSKWSKR